MRKIIAITLCLCILLSFTGCKKEQTKQKPNTKTKVTINLAEDNSVNGYRTNPNKADDTEIPADKIVVQTPTTEITDNTDTQSIQYCGNLNSKTFHKATCTFVKRMSEENKYYTSDRNLLTEQGFTPCKSCNP